MNISERDSHLDTVLGIQKEEPEQEIMPVETFLPTKQTVPERPSICVNDHEKEVTEIKVRLKNIHAQLEDVLTSHTQNAIDFGKSRDVESVAKLATAMVEVNREIRQSSESINKDESEKSPSYVQNQQNIMITGNTREILDLIAKKEREANGEE